MTHPAPAVATPRSSGSGRALAGAAALLLCLLVLLASPAHALTFPQFTGLVVDAAHILPAERAAALTAKLEAFQQKTGRQLVVATVPSLEGQDISDYGYQLGRAWGVGLKDVNNGAILLVAPNERRVRIEAGYGLEPVLTDAFSSVIITTQILPRFKAGDIPGGIEAGADAIVTQLSLPDDQAKARLDAAVAAFDKAHRRGNDGAPLSLVFWGIVAAFVILSMLRNRGGGQRYRSGGGPVVLWGPGLGGGWGGSGGFGGGGGSSSGGGWMGGGFSGGGGGGFGGGGASGGW